MKGISRWPEMRGSIRVSPERFTPQAVEEPRATPGRGRPGMEGGRDEEQCT